MFVAKSVETEHKDLIHDVAYDHYGRRMATCSSDQSIKVWDIAEDGTSQQVAHWKAHSGSVWRVTWAHPEFGQVLGMSRYCVCLVLRGRFSDATKHLHNWLCPLVGRSVCLERVRLTIHTSHLIGLLGLVLSCARNCR